MPDFLALALAGTKPDQALEEVISRWPLDQDDPQVGISLERLKRRWASWAEPERWMFLSLVEEVAAGERWKLPDRRRTRAKRYETVQRQGVKAMKLANELLDRFHPDGAPAAPSHDLGVMVVLAQNPDTAAAIRHTVVALASMTVGCFYATGMPDKIPIYPQIGASLAAFREVHGRPRWELLAEIATLATGKTVTIDTIRRYLKPGSLKAVGFSKWNAHETMIERVSRFAEPELIYGWYAACSAFLAVEPL